MKKAYLFSALAGLSWALSAAPRDFPPIGFLGAPLLLIAIEVAQKANARARSIFAVGLLSGFACNAVVLGWIVGLLQTFGHFPLIAALPVGSLLWLAQGLPFAFAALGTHYLSRFNIPAWISLPATITIATAITPALFPWHIATSQLPFTVYVQLADVGGTPLLDVLLALTGCAAWEAFRTRSKRVALIALVSLAVPVVYGAVRLPLMTMERNASRLTRVGVVQPNVGIDEKHDPRLAWEQVERLHSMTRHLEENLANIVVWPETAYPYALRHDARHISRGVDSPLPEGMRVPLLFGTITQDHDRVYNSAMAVEPDGDVLGVSDKVQLLAFGEYVPLWDFLPPLRHYFPRRGISPGHAPRVLAIGDLRIGVLNCYEDVLDMYARRVAQHDPDYLVNVTNDAWFGDTAEPYLHNSVARFRAIETRRDLVRAVNTGVSSHIASTGEVLYATETWRQTSFIADVRTSHTVTLWMRFGDVTTPALAAFLIAWAMRERRRTRLQDLAAKTKQS
ncbi:MAG: apolipoprotein N-acyltransferase [Sandaracinaceae bacterium]|jgi:apolipoprotein N-acyltransferase|nr:apolipoprotein N-acyltransferase [Sandaracinaceae bacterium]